jgi:WD40 repeat protein
VLRDHTRAVAAVVFSPDADLLASASWDNTVRLWKLGGRAAESWATLKGSPSGLAFSPDGKRLAAGNPDTTVFLWDLTGEKPDRKTVLSGHKNRPFALAFSPGGTMFASGCFDPVLRVWKLGADEPELWGALTNEKAPSLGIASLAFSADGKLLAAGCHAGDSTLRVWKVAGQFLEERELPRAQARLVAFSPAGSTLAFAGTDAKIHLWDMVAEPPKSIGTLTGHPLKRAMQPVLALAFSPDGRTLATAGKDKKLILWQIREGKVLREWQLADEPRALDFASDGRHLAVGLENGTILVLRHQPAGQSP